MKVRLSTVGKGKHFTYKGREYVMHSVKPAHDRRSGATFRWVLRVENGEVVQKWLKFTVNGNTMVTLLRSTKPKTIKEVMEKTSQILAKRPLTLDPKHGEQVRAPLGSASAMPRQPKVIVSKGAHLYRVTASWWDRNAQIKKRAFLVNADSAAAAIAKVEGLRKNANLKVKYTVARMEG